MKTQKFGLEIELTGITRAKAAEVAMQFFGSGARLEQNRVRDEYRVITADGGVWKFVNDGSILPWRKERGRMVQASIDYRVEVVSPILTYEDMPQLQALVRYLRGAGAVSSSEYRCGLHVHVDAAKHTPKSLLNLMNLVASKEELIYKSLGVDMARIQYCKKVNERLLTTINQRKPKTMQALADAWYAEYAGQSRSNHYHESRYYGCNLHSVFEKGTVEFRLGNGCLHAGKLRALLVLCLAISHQALRQRTASPRRTTTDNEKFTFRTWLVRLGLIGDGFKACRAHLMANLTGDAAWRTEEVRRRHCRTRV